MSKRTISRRTLLRGTGAALGLPWLEAMMPARASAAEMSKGGAPVRIAALYVPNGMHEPTWTPKLKGAGSEWELSEGLLPLTEFKPYLNVFTNLWNQGSKSGDGHYVKLSGWLTSTTISKTLGVDISCNGVSMDQLAARAAGKATPFPSLELAIAPVTTGVDRNVGYTRIYGSHIAWAGPTQPLAREINPRSVFERLFRATTGQNLDTAKQDQLLLDRVLEDAKELRGQLGKADQHRMDEYLTVVRSLEARLERAAAPEQTNWKPRVALDESAKPAGIPKDFPEHVRLMLDMMALAFQTDSTRICTFMFGNEVTNQSFRFLDGVGGGHHDSSHHQNNDEKLRDYFRISQWHVQQFAYLLEKLQGMKEGDSTVLDNSMLLFGAGIRDGNKHDPHNLPLVLAGKAGGRLRTDQHLMYGVDSPLANVFVSMLDAFGTPVERFADSTGPAAGLLNS